VQPVGPAWPGDYDQSNIVDAADYVSWRKTFGTTGVPAFSGADGDGDTMIDVDDYNVWRAHFGEPVTMPSTGSATLGSKLSGPEVSLDEFLVAAAFELDPTAQRELCSGGKERPLLELRPADPILIASQYMGCCIGIVSTRMTPTICYCWRSNRFEK